MNPYQMDSFRRQLVQRRDQLTAHKREDLELSLKDATGELSSYDNHSSDLGSETAERSKDMALEANREVTIEKIDQALERMEEGVYGLCNECGREIEDERLQIIPFTTLCLNCKDTDEEPDWGRPIEEDLTSMAHFRDYREDQAIFDGEDAWQKVARYGNANSSQDEPDSIKLDEAFVNAGEDQGSVQDVEEVIDERGTGVTDLRAIYSLDTDDEEEG